MFVVIHPVANSKSFKSAFYTVLKDFLCFFAPEKKMILYYTIYCIIYENLVNIYGKIFYFLFSLILQ